MMKKLFLIIGAPGSGKTTDAEIIAKNMPNVSHYSTGDMLRAEVASGSERGKEIQKYIDAGEIVPIEIVIDTITKAIKNAPTDVVIIDGYPRSLEQMHKLDEYLKEHSDIKLCSVIEVRVSQETAQERVLGRARGEDDSEAVFAHRMEVYTKPLEAIRSFYEQKHLLHVISGEADIESVVAEMQSFIEAKLSQED